MISMGRKSHCQRLGSNQILSSIGLGLDTAAPGRGRGTRKKERTAWCGQFVAALSGTRRIFDQKKKNPLLLGIKIKSPILAMRSFPAPYRPDKSSWLPSCQEGEPTAGTDSRISGCPIGPHLDSINNGFSYWMTTEVGNLENPGPTG